MSDSIAERYRRSHNDTSRSLASIGAEADDDLGAFGWLRGQRERAIMLELRRKNGNVFALSYAWLERAEFDPSLGITLSFADQRVRITGRNLNAEVRAGVRLFEGIVRHRVPWIQEQRQSNTQSDLAGIVTIVAID